MPTPITQIDDALEANQFALDRIAEDLAAPIDGGIAENRKLLTRVVKAARRPILEGVKGNWRQLDSVVQPIEAGIDAAIAENAAALATVPQPEPPSNGSPLNEQVDFKLWCNGQPFEVIGDPLSLRPGPYYVRAWRVGDGADSYCDCVYGYDYGPSPGDPLRAHKSQIDSRGRVPGGECFRLAAPGPWPSQIEGFSEPGGYGEALQLMHAICCCELAAPPPLECHPEPLPPPPAGCKWVCQGGAWLLACDGTPPPPPPPPPPPAAGCLCIDLRLPPELLDLLRCLTDRCRRAPAGDDGEPSDICVRVGDLYP